VAQIKSYQAASEDEKQLWGSYVDLYLKGVKDPNRHDAATLQEFAVNHQLPPPAMHWGAGATPDWVAGPDSMKEPMVQRVKAFQKAGAEQKEAWHSFCGATKDPSRHEVNKLREFIISFSVP